jgi:predicted NAD/FAD-dependent oxidoreductase
MEGVRRLFSGLANVPAKKSEQAIEAVAQQADETKSGSDKNVTKARARNYSRPPWSRTRLPIRCCRRVNTWGCGKVCHGQVRHGAVRRGLVWSGAARFGWAW